MYGSQLLGCEIFVVMAFIGQQQALRTVRPKRTRNAAGFMAGSIDSESRLVTRQGSIADGSSVGRTGDSHIK